MGIDEMIRREDFYRILQETLVEYYAKVRHVAVSCSYEPFEGGEELRMFYYGSMICRAHKPKGARKYLNAELNIRSSLWKYIAGKMMVQYLMMTKSTYSPGSVYLTKDALGKNELISAQNRSVRIYDFDKSTVDCIIKQGFTNRYFNNQIAFRKQYKYDFMVPLIESGDGWFREPILKGHPLARVTGKNKYQKGIDTAVHDIQILAKDTLEYKSSQEYVPELLAKAKQLTARARQVKNIDTYEKCITLLDFVEKGFFNVSIEIPTCISHGDLQTGNIWMDNKGKVLVYDWETAGRRSVWYDCATLLYSLRRVYGWEQFLNDKTPVQALACDPNTSRTNEEFDSIKRIVLLEDYLFLMEDMMELPMDWGKDVFDRNIKRIHQAVIEKACVA